MDNVNEFIKLLNISEDEYVVLACSYGPDSMCLLDILIKNGITDVDVTVDDYDTVYGLDITVNCNRDFITYSIFFNSEDDIEVMYDIGVNTDSAQNLCRCKSLRACANNIAKHFSLYYNG